MAASTQATASNARVLTLRRPPRSPRAAAQPHADAKTIQARLMLLQGRVANRPEILHVITHCTGGSRDVAQRLIHDTDVPARRASAPQLADLDVGVSEEAEVIGFLRA
jgi:hypothetical protein